MRKLKKQEGYREFNRDFILYHKRKSRRKNYSYVKHTRKYGPANRSIKSIRAVKNKTANYFAQMGTKSEFLRSMKIKSGRIDFKLPSDFCFIHSPESAIRSIYNAYRIAKTPEIKTIHLDHSKVSRYNLTSEVLLGLCIETEKTRRRLRKSKKSSKWKTKNRKLNILGTLPKDEDHKQLISEIGVVKELSAQTNHPTPFSTKRQHLFSKKSVGISIASAYSNDDKTKSATQFCGYVNNCVEEHKLSLTQEAKTQLLLTLSEVLDNAERHSSHDGQSHMWYAKGYLNSESSHENLEISLFNFGMTIADTFEQIPDSTFGKQLVMDYVNAHLRTDLSREQLITVAALQHRYSSKNIDSTDTNGQGTICLIEFFERFCDDLSLSPAYGNVKPEMSIVSGKTHIVFDGTYRLSNLTNYTEDGLEQLIIAFNDENSLKSPPDPRYVKKMTGDAYFPGVAISIRIPLKEENVNGEYNAH